jgi:hypothetical protein
VTGPDREIEVNLSGKAYVKVMDRMNFYLYQKGEEYEFYGKEEKVTYLRIKPPSLGRWFIIVDTSESIENISVDLRILD